MRQDRIDILVDLTMHMARNRMLVFARKPAPVQVTLSGLLRHHGPGHDGLPADRSVPGSAGCRRSVLLRGIDPPARDLLVLPAAGRLPAGRTLCRPWRRAA